MADKKVEGPELKKLVKMGKKRRMNFAFCPDPKGKHVIVIDRVLKPKPLSQAAKAEGAGTRVAFGTYVLNEKTLELTCEKTVPVMAKQLKKYLKTQKTLVNVVIMDADGNVLDSDVEDLPDEEGWDDEADGETDSADNVGEDKGQGEDQAEDQKTAASPADGPIDKAELVNRIKALQPGIAAAPGNLVGKLGEGLKKAVGEIKNDALEQAEAMISKLETVVAKIAEQKTAAAASTQAEDSGQTSESVEKAEPEQAKQAAAPAAPDVRTLAARANGLRDAIADIQGPAREKLVAALKEAAGKIRGADLSGADALLGRIETAVNKTMAAVAESKQAKATEAAAEQRAENEGAQPEAKEEEGPSSEEEAADDNATKAKEWAAAEARLQPAVDKLMQDKRGDLGAINRAFNYAKDQAKAGNFESALKAAQRADDLVRAAADATTTAAVEEAQDAIPDDVVHFVKSRLAWINTRKALYKQVNGLKAAVDRVASSVEGLEDIGSSSGVLFDYLSDIDSDLENTLEKLVETPDGDARETLKSNARAIISDYHELLDTDFFKAVDDNGFVKTDIRNAAMTSLGNVSAALDQ